MEVVVRQQGSGHAGDEAPHESPVRSVLTPARVVHARSVRRSLTAPALKMTRIEVRSSIICYYPYQIL